MPGVIGTKVGMTSVYDQDGRSIPVTIIQAGPCVVTQVKNTDSDGYRSIQLSYGEKKQKNATKPLQGHFKKAKTTPKKHLVEFRNFRQEYDGMAELGNEIKVEHVFKEGDWLDAIGISKGKGFQGVVKRYGFSGVGGQTHGQHNRLRAPGSIGGSSSPSRVFKGKKMAGQTGNKRVKTLNLKVIKIIPDKNIILVKGAVPGAKKGTIVLEK